MRLGNVLAIAGVLGAAAWIGRWAVDGTASDGVGDVLLWVGAALLTVLSVGVGTLMVRPLPLKAVVGPCVGLLAWSLGAVIGVDGDALRAGIVGLVLLVVVPVTWERLRPLAASRAAERAAAGGSGKGSGTRAAGKAQRAGSHAR
jgi:hypothetical protein